MRLDVGGDRSGIDTCLVSGAQKTRKMREFFSLTAPLLFSTRSVG
jgi:hypothetical protein